MKIAVDPTFTSRTVDDYALKPFADDVRSAVAASISPNTMRSYASQFRTWSRWAVDHGLKPLPASPEAVAAFLTQRAKGTVRKRRASISTIRMAASAIATAHRYAELPNPCEAPIVIQTLRGLSRALSRPPAQALALTSDALDAIERTAMLPRPLPGGGAETPEKARRRGLVDIALCRVMSDGGLRRGEAAELRWSDIERWADGTGRVTIRRSKSDPQGGGHVVAITRQAMRALDSIRGSSEPESSVFGYCGAWISVRITKAAEAAGLGKGFRGHSGRVGMARRMTAAGAPVVETMRQGRWQSSVMVAKYTRGESAGSALKYLT